MVAVPVWALKVACYYAFITCDTAPGVWPENTPTVIAYHPPVSTPSSTSSSTAEVSSTAVATSTLSFTSSASVPALSSIVTGSLPTVAPTTTAASTFVTFTTSSSIVDSASASVTVTVPSGSSSVLTQSGSSSVSSASSSSAVSSASTVVASSSASSSPVSSATSSASSSSIVSPSESSSVSSPASSTVPSSPASSSLVSSVTSSSVVSSSASSSVSSTSTAVPSSSASSSAASSAASSPAVSSPGSSSISSASTAIPSSSASSSPASSATSSSVITPSGSSSVSSIAVPSTSASSASSVASSSAVSSPGSSSISSASTAVSSSLASSSAVSSATSSSVVSSASVSTSASLTTPIMSSTLISISASATASATPLSHAAVAAEILIIARDAASAGVASSGLNGYGIPFSTLIVPSAGVELPELNGTAGGNFGGIVVASEVSYDYGTLGFQSALTTDQWNQLYAYQLEYGVRMVQYDVYPGPNYGASAIGGCCDGVEQLISLTDTSEFPTSGLKTGAGISTTGLWHYPATISNTTSTKQFAAFAPTTGFEAESVAGVINDFDGRQQMAFFIGFDTTWSSTSSYLQHAWITWITRGLHAGYRRVNLNTQIDDMFLETDIYSPAGTTFRIRAEDLTNIASWIDTINAKLPAGSSYFVEVGHNGNGNIENASDTSDAGWDTCGAAIEYDSPLDTPLEWIKPLGTGTDLWPATPTAYDWEATCTVMDELLAWWTTESNLNKFGHISHTFTHEEQDNATYSDIYKEISFNQAWLKQVGIDKATKFTSNGIIPPAITGLHNGDALQAWWDNGIVNCVGDNTRSALLNQENDMWPLFTTVANNGFDGMQVNPRWASRIYYNCDTPDCTVAEWIATSAGVGGFQDLLDIEKAETMRHFFGLFHDPYMFHQANLRNADVDPITINGVAEKYSIMQAWVETQVQEFIRLAEWPVVTLTHQEMSAAFLARFNRDKCGYSLSYATSNQKITAVTVSATGNTCTDPIPVTFPVAPTSTLGFATEQLGADPLTVWVELTGSPVTFTLSTPISF
ncbi:CAZyme family CBM87 and CE18 [Penicillium roqueforti]|nr:CAZyme family CBM87 and CE18 [Penicillium roqueforti]